MKRSPPASNPNQSRKAASDAAEGLDTLPRSRRQIASRPPKDPAKLGNTEILIRAEEKLKKTEQLLEDIQRMARLGNWEWDLRTNEVTWSKELYRIFGRNPDTFQPTYEKYLECVHPDDREETRMQIESALRNKTFVTTEHRIVLPDGSIRHLENEAEIKLDANNQLVRMLGCSLDVTERRGTEQKLARSLSLLAATLESTADGILVVDDSGKLARSNRKFAEMWRIPEEVIQSYNDDRALEIALQQLKYPQLFANRVQHLYEHPEMESFDVLELKDGRIFERFSKPQRLGDKIIGRVWSFRDVTDRYRVLENMRQSEERYRSLVIASSQVVWRSDSDGLVLDDATSCREFTGMKFEEISRGNWLDAVHPDDRAHAAHVWSGAVNTRSIYETQYRIRRSDGQWRNMYVRGVPLFEKSGAIREWIGFCQDITEQKQAQDALARQCDFMNNLVNSLPGIFYLLDQTGLNLRWNENLEKLTGYTAEEISRMHAIEFVPEEERAMLAERVKKVFNEGYAYAKIHLLSKAGKKVLHFCTGTRVELEGQPRLVGMGVDISQLEKAQAEIGKLNRDLGKRVEERTAQLNASNKELESFSYSVSHDLRAPLRAISGFAKVIREDFGDKLGEDGNLFLEKILQAGDRMSHLIDDLLNYSRIGRGAVTPHPVSLTNLLSQILSDFSQRIKAVGGKVSVQNDLPVVMGDVTLLGQVFTNLFENAINYRKREVPLEVSVTFEKRGDSVVLNVRDNGTGIAPAHHERIFEVFQRLQTQLPGTGIGLANVKKSVEILGGQVWVESELGEGSTFCIKLKLAKADADLNNESHLPD